MDYSCIDFQYKVVRNLAVSQTKLMFFVPSEELISRTDSWKAPKLGTLINTLFPKRCWGILKFRLLPIFTALFPKKTLNFANIKCLDLSWKRNKKSKIPSTVLQTPSSLCFKNKNLSMMFSNWDQFVGGHRLLNTFSGFSKNSPGDISLFLTSLDLHSKPYQNPFTNS